MIKKFHIVLILLTLGFFATPTLAYACGTKTIKTEKSSCKKSKYEKDNKKDCCKNHISKNEKGCDKKCNNSNCSCPTTNFAFSIPFWAELRAKIYFAESKKTKSYYNETFPYSCFVSIWTPPKIG